VYCALDPATTILELAAHIGIEALDNQRRVLTCFEIVDPSDVHIVMPSEVPNSHWLRPSVSTHSQRLFGDSQLKIKPFVAIPSVVSPRSWSLLFSPTSAAGLIKNVVQETFTVVPRLAINTP
jgi:RES domain-containing protein